LIAEELCETWRALWALCGKKLNHKGSQGKHKVAQRRKVKD
jgi:hypothetical protein